MPRKAKELPAVALKRLPKPGQKERPALYPVGGVPGLCLTVSKTGARWWTLRATIRGRRAEIGLGAGYPELGLAAARDRARDLREAIRQGHDPIAERKDARARAEAQLTFDQCAQSYIEGKKAGWRNAKHAAQWASSLERYASPVIGRLPVEQVKTDHVERILRPIWERIPTTADRVRQRLESVLSWATSKGLRQGENPARWKNHLEYQFPSPGKVRPVQHFKALAIDDIPGFMAALRERGGMGARALEFVILTACRSGEVRRATWSEINLDKATWTVPAERTKSGREHVVPLSDATLVLLKALPRKDDAELVFPAAAGRPLSDMSLSAVLRRMEVVATVHGMRSSFKDWGVERTGFPHEVSEMALAHTIRSGTERAYRRGDLFKKRVKLMDAWAGFCAAAQGGKVLAFEKKRA